VGAALLPDIVDKPLSFMVTSLPSRSFAHSIFTVALVSLVISYVTRRADRREFGVAAVFGYLSHISADLVDSQVIPAEPLVFVFWPLITDYHHIDSIEGLLALISPTPYVVLQMVLTVLGVGLWVYDGKPGLASSPAEIQ
jgi:membrane-bound metal-dependent hydrolase YbcI (DUF457 family)